MDARFLKLSPPSSRTTHISNSPYDANTTTSRPLFVFCQLFGRLRLVAVCGVLLTLDLGKVVSRGRVFPCSETVVYIQGCRLVGQELVAVTQISGNACSKEHQRATTSNGRHRTGTNKEFDCRVFESGAAPDLSDVTLENTVWRACMPQNSPERCHETAVHPSIFGF